MTAAGIFEPRCTGGRYQYSYPPVQLTAVLGPPPRGGILCAAASCDRIEARGDPAPVAKEVYRRSRVAGSVVTLGWAKFVAVGVHVHSMQCAPGSPLNQQPPDGR